MTPKSLMTVSECRELVESWRLENLQVSLVPTMGALHQGHLSLVKKAKELGDKVIVSIFVNPTQFGPSEDFARYPRNLAKDFSLLEGVGVDAVFSPTANEMYGPDFQTWVSNDGITDILCGQSRPGHFRGVCTVVIKLMNMTSAQYCLFGKKDYQQFKIIANMVRDLNIKTQVVACDIMRSDTGLALSSRNQLLSESELEIAPNIFFALSTLLQTFSNGCHLVETLVDGFKNQLAEFEAIKLEYIEVRRERDLAEISGEIEEYAIVFVAAKLGAVRLIDNIELRL
ncbi:MAG: pantoate--beta-alanine ligase [Bdellovibrionota bacterium]